jgi:hypothetical protein
VRARVEQPDAAFVVGVVFADGRACAVGAEAYGGNRDAPSIGPPDSPAGERIQERHRSMAVAHREGSAVGREVDGVQRVARTAHRADCRRGAQQGVEEVASGDGRIVDGDALAGQQQRSIEVGLGLRLRADPLCFGGLGLAARGAALVYGDQCASDGDGQQRCDPCQHDAQAALRTIGRGAAGVEEGALGRVELVLVAAAPLPRHREPRTAVQVAGIAPPLVPVACRVGEVTLDAAALGVLLEPAAQSRPFAKQRFVGDLDFPLADGDQPIVGQRVKDLRDAIVALGLQFGQWHAPRTTAVPSPSPASRSRIRRATSRCVGTSRS